MSKTIKTIHNLETRGRVTNEQAKILTTISGNVEKNMVKSKRPSIYYRAVNGRDLAVCMVIDDYDSKVEDKIYGLQSRVISKYKDNEIDFRLTPKHKRAESKIVPRGYQKLAIA
ncbi:MAG: hypothetical protein U9R14_03735 [Patescibacteria group bacterium]|nr:hypothetical protein [Patescibacteria group bacterium]